LDRAVDPNTGTIKARLVFPNHQRLLKVGVTCNVLIKNNGGDSSLLIPYKAITQQLGENFVFVVVNKNDTTKQALQRKVELGTKVGDKIVVKSGVEKGQYVVTEGNQKLKDSSFVQVGPKK
jgi:multidrug efflux pump subunit AcrA (membrane-fusion protein)